MRAILLIMDKEKGDPLLLTPRRTKLTKEAVKPNMATRPMTEIYRKESR
jgi:hypothetical protein